jgi:TolB-like protein
VWGGVAAAAGLALLAAALAGPLGSRGGDGAAIGSARLVTPGAAGAPAARGAAAPPASVAVLPFVYIGEDTTQSYLAASAGNAVAGALTRVRGLRVSSRTAATALQQRLALGDTSAVPVRALIEGVVEREGSRVRLSVRLVDPRDGFMLWADRFEGDASNRFAMEDQVAAAMEARLREHFGLAAAGAPPGPPPPPRPPVAPAR